MKKLFSILFCFTTLTVCAQGTANKDVSFPPLDTSPADIVYYPINAAKAKADGDSKPIIKIIYSRPQLKGRVIFGVLEQFGKVWRLGANENTEITFFEKVEISGKRIKPGIYSLFAIPEKDSWTVIINKQTDKWGAFTYNESKDVVRVKVSVNTLPKSLEYLSLTFAKTSLGANLEIAWDKTLVELPITFK